MSSKDKSDKKYIGQHVGKYELIKNIGGGGNAEVWKVRYHNNYFAMKILKTYDESFPQKYSRFREEIKVVIKNQGKGGIVPIIDFCLPKSPVEGEDVWYIMPLAKPLNYYFNLDSHNIKEVVLCVKDLTKHLINFHSKGIVHRDIKPSNLYRYKENWCFGDFGLVDYPDKKDITKKWEVVGPKWTMAPEMRRNAKNSDGKKADIYSLAKTLWILLTGVKTGFEGQYDDNIDGVKLRDFFKTEYIVDLEILLKESTSNDPAERPSADEFYNQLERWKINNSDFKKRNLMEWNYIKNKIFKFSSPNRAEWVKKDEIVKILNIISETPSLNHMFCPDGGGMDLEDAKRSSQYENCIELKSGGLYHIVNPNKLIFENINDDEKWSYFRLETNIMNPSNVFDSEYYEENSIEEVVDVGNCEFIHPKYWRYKHYNDKLLPNGSRHIARVLRGSFVIFGKASDYNSIPSTYDGRHDKMDADDFRKEVERLKDYNEYFLANKESIEKRYLGIQQKENAMQEIKAREHRKQEKELLDKLNKFILEELNVDVTGLMLNNTDSAESACVYGIDIIAEGTFNDKNIYKLKKNSKFLLYKSAKRSYFADREIDLNDDAIFESQGKASDAVNRIKECLSEFNVNPEVYCFEIVMKRIREPSHLFTEKEIEDVLRSGDDEYNNILVINDEGEARLIRQKEYEYYEISSFPVRNETFCAFNNYVGKYSSLYNTNEENEKGKEYVSCLEGWLEHLKGKLSIYKDGNFSGKSEDELIKEIRELIKNKTDKGIWKKFKK